MYSLGHEFVSPADTRRRAEIPRHGPAGERGGCGGLIEPRAMNQLKCYESAMFFARTRGTSRRGDLACNSGGDRRGGEGQGGGQGEGILFNWSGHGLMDLKGYESYMEGKLTDYPLPEEDLRRSLRSIDGLPKPKVVKTGRW
jgi:tryptophan synthase beta chain